MSIRCIIAGGRLAIKILGNAIYVLHAQGENIPKRFAHIHTQASAAFLPEHQCGYISYYVIKAQPSAYLPLVAWLWREYFLVVNVFVELFAAKFRIVCRIQNVVIFPAIGHIPVRPLGIS